MTNRIQISSQVSEQTRKEYEEICEFYGYTGREALALAIRDMYQKMQAEKAKRSNPKKSPK